MNAKLQPYLSGVGASLMDHNWLEQLTLKWKDIHNINSDKLQEVPSEFSEVFQPGVGMSKNFKVKIFVDPSFFHVSVKLDLFLML